MNSQDFISGELLEQLEYTNRMKEEEEGKVKINKRKLYNKL